MIGETPEPRGYNIHANGIRLHLLHYPGSGPSMLIVPGITSPAITWGFVSERLADNFDVHVLDVRGRGLSSAGDLEYSLDAMADDVLALSEALDLRDYTLLGHSMGARVGIRASVKNEGRIGHLILVDPPVSGPDRRAYPADLDWYIRSMAIARRGCSADEMRAFCPTWSEEQLALRAEWLHTCEEAAIIAAYEGFHADDIHADLPKVRVPTRLVVAGGAPVIQEEDVAEIRALLPQIEVRTVEGAGHMIPWDDLNGFLAAIVERPREV